MQAACHARPAEARGSRHGTVACHPSCSGGGGHAGGAGQPASPPARLLPLPGGLPAAGRAAAGRSDADSPLLAARPPSARAPCSSAYAHLPAWPPPGTAATARRRMPWGARCQGSISPRGWWPPKPCRRQRSGSASRRPGPRRRRRSALPARAARRRRRARAARGRPTAWRPAACTMTCTCSGGWLLQGGGREQPLGKPARLEGAHGGSWRRPLVPLAPVRAWRWHVSYERWSAASEAGLPWHLAPWAGQQAGGITWPCWQVRWLSCVAASASCGAERGVSCQAPAGALQRRRLVPEPRCPNALVPPRPCPPPRSPAGPTRSLVSWARLPLPLLLEGSQFCYPLRQCPLPAPALQLALSLRAGDGWDSTLWHPNLPMLAARSGALASPAMRADGPVGACLARGPVWHAMGAGSVCSARCESLPSYPMGRK